MKGELKMQLKQKVECDERKLKMQLKEKEKIKKRKKGSKNLDSDYIIFDAFVSCSACLISKKQIVW